MISLEIFSQHFPCQVKKLTEASFILEDANEVWDKLGKEAIEAGTRVATVNNLDRINM